MADYTEEDLAKAREWLETELGDYSETEERALAAFRAEARREARKDWTAAMDDARHSGYQQGVQEEAERCQSEREACVRIVEGMAREQRAMQSQLGIKDPGSPIVVAAATLEDAARRLRERAK